MRLKNVPGSREAVSNSEFCISNPENYKGRWREDFFHNNDPIYIEIGMGKGNFIINSAIREPSINFIGIEMYSSVLIRAVEQMEELKNKNEDPKNLIFTNFDATYIEKLFDKNETDRIYLNFSDPWPKDRHTKRRLTSERFLNRYINFLKPDGEIHFKTDNNNLFDFSIEELQKQNWKILAVSRDLHNDPVMNEGNIMTEYESRFSRNGVKINKLIARRPSTQPPVHHQAQDR